MTPNFLLKSITQIVIYLFPSLLMAQPSAMPSSAVVQQFKNADSLASYYDAFASAALTYYGISNDSALCVLKHCIDSAWRTPITPEEYNTSGYVHLLGGFFNGNNSDFLQSKTYYSKAMQLYKNGNKSDYYVYTSNISNLANIYTRFGENKMADTYYSIGAKCINDTNDSYYDVSSVADFHNNRALNYVNQGLHLAARKELQKGILTPNLGSKHKCMLLTTAANWHLDYGTLDSAHFYIDLAINNALTARQTENSIDVALKLAFAYKAKGRVLQEQKKHVEALKLLRMSLQLMEESFDSKQNRELAKVYLTIAKHFEITSDFDSALVQYQNGYRALKVQLKGPNPHGLPALDSLYTEVTFSELFLGQAEMYSNWYKTSSNSDHLERAKNLYQLYFDAEFNMREAFLFKESNYLHSKELHTSAQKAVAVCIQLYNKDSNTEHLWDGFSFSETVKGLVLSQALLGNDIKQFPLEVRSLIDDIKRVEIDLSILEGTKIQKGNQAHLDTLAVYRKKLGGLQEAFKFLYPDYHRKRYSKKIPNRKEVLEFLVKKQANILSILWGSDVSYFFLVNQDGSIQCKEVPITLQINTQLKQLKTLLASDTGSPQELSALSKLSHTAYKTFLADLFGAASHKKIYVLPDGPFSTLPLGALCTNLPSDVNNFGAWNFLIQNTEFNYSPSLRFLFRPTNSTIEGLKNKLIFHAEFANNSAYNPHLLALSPSPNSQQEINFWNAEVYKGNQALGALFIDKAPHFQVLEVFTHAFSDSLNPNGSGLYFEGDTVPTPTGYALLAAQLHTIELNARLSILIGCGTGTGNYIPGEGVQSLAYQFATIGSDNIVATLWMPNQDPARDFLDRYNLQMHSSPFPGTALQQTKNALLSDPNVANKMKHPSRWASFVLIGAGDELTLPSASMGGSFWLLATVFGVLAIVILFLLRRRFSKKQDSFQAHKNNS